MKATKRTKQFKTVFSIIIMIT